MSGKSIDIVALVNARTRAWALSRGYSPDGEVEEGRNDFLHVLRMGSLHVGRDVVEKTISWLDSKLGINVRDVLTPPKGEGSDRSFFRPAIMVVPVKNPNSHSYKVDAPCFVCKGDQALMVSSSGKLEKGNHLPAEFSAIRPATEEEIFKFFSKVKDSFLATLLEEMV